MSSSPTSSSGADTIGGFVPPPLLGQAPAVPSALVGMLFFLGTEVMVFAGLISSFLILRAGSPWPPAGEPRLPAVVSAMNSLFLLASGAAMVRARRAVREDDRGALRRWLLVTTVLGLVFLTVQGLEWVRLVSFGLTLRSSLYGATFYTLIGVHGLHVAGGMAALLFVLKRARAGRYSAANHIGVDVCWLYWSFVVAVWPVLYVLVYAS